MCEIKLVSVPFFLLLLLLLSFPCLSDQDGRTAFDYYKSGEYEQSYFLYRNLAMTGDHDAQFNVGVMYLKGQHVQRDMADAYAWIKLASEGQNTKYRELVEKLNLRFSEKERLAAEEVYRQLKQKFGRSALQQYLTPTSLPDDECDVEAEVVELYPVVYPSVAANLGKPGFVDLIFDISKEGLARDIRVTGASDSVFTKAAVRSIQRSTWQPKQSVDGVALLSRNKEFRFVFKYADARFKTNLIRKDAKSLLKKAEKGDTLAQFKYARTLNSLRAFEAELKGVRLEYKDANEWFLRAAESGNRYAQYEIGKNLLQGKGCAAEVGKGYVWLKASASAGHTLAQTEMAMSPLIEIEDGIGSRVYWLRKAVSANHMLAKLYLAWELSTNADPGKNQVPEAMSLLENLELKNYFDEIRVLETKAAVLAAAGDYDQAIAVQQEALNEADLLGWTAESLVKRLSVYKNSKPWQGEYHL